MLSALPSTQRAPRTTYNAPSCSYDRPSPHSAGVHYSSPAMHGKPSSTSVSSNASSVKARPFVTSLGQMLSVYNYSPQDGPAGTSIVVTVLFNLIRTDTTFLRIVIGRRALSTTVRAAQSRQENEWELEAVVPDLETLATDVLGSTPSVPLTVEALDSSNETLDTVTFGKFSYTSPRATHSPLLPCKQEITDNIGFGPSSAPSTPNLKPPNHSPYPSHTHPTLSRKSSRPTPASGTARARALNATMAAKDAQVAHGQLKKQSLIRARRASSDDDDADNNFRAVLSINTPTDPMASVQDWDAEERRIGRRLVRFTRVQDGCTLQVACEAIRPAEYSEGDTVVSCIYRPPDAAGPGDPHTSQCCITSVDIIFLLECLVGDIFNIEEKNRIRRNLEGFRPKTVSKNKVGTEKFFQKIMDFPTPKPRNIEKDVKVFDWAVLPQALDKIISKYTLYPIVKKQDGNATPPIPELTSSSPQPQSSTPCYSTSPSPASGHNPTASQQQQSYFYHQTAYHNSPSQYVPGSLNGLDRSYVTAGSLPSSSYDNFLSPSHHHSTNSCPSPLLSIPGESPNSASLSYPEPSPSMYHSYPGQGAYGSNMYSSSYSSAEYQRMKTSPLTDLQEPPAYL